jgi:cytochrome b561
MQIRNTRNGYGAVARALHWSMAALMIGLIGLGLYMTAQPDGDPKWGLYDLHKSLGVLVFGLLLLRVFWRRSSAFGGYHISVFSLFDIPMLFEKNKPLFELTVLTHRWIAYGLGLLVLAHAGAALKHHFIQRDDVLLRMLKDRPD